MEIISQAFKNDKVLLLYKCGSYAFGTATDKSDEDYVVVLRDFKGLTHLSHGKKEYFIFGLEDWKEKQEFSDQLDEYFEIFNDEVLAFPYNILNKDESMDELIEYYKSKFTSNYKKWISKVVSYFRFYYDLGDINKNMYHLLRIRFMVENYLKTGSFSLELSEKVLNKILNFKASTDKEAYRTEINGALIYLQNLREA